MSKSTSGRPLRFFMMVMGGWIAIRLLAVTSAPSPAETMQASLPLPGPLLIRRPPAPVIAPSSPNPVERSESSQKISAPQNMKFASGILRNAVLQRSPAGISNAPDETAHASPSTGIEATGAGQTSDPATAAIPVLAAGRALSGRWTGGAWLLWRSGDATPAQALPAGRLGGSQAGFRVDYDLAPAAPGRPFLYGRISAALHRPRAAEGALGLGWQPARSIPFSIATERRIALSKGARNAQAFLIVGGLGPTPAIGGIEAEGYTQAGMVGLHSTDLFADGKFSLMKRLTGSPVRIGASVSGGMQPAVERLDVGPELQIRLPIPAISSRISIEWRERIAGQAAPPSGLAVTLGGDF